MSSPYGKTQPPRKSIVFLFTFEDGTQEVVVRIYDTDARVRKLFAMVQDPEPGGLTTVVLP